MLQAPAPTGSFTSAASEHEDLTTIWLWSEQKGVVSHETALMLHNLSDVLPRKTHLTLPASWAKRCVRVPKGVVLYHEDVPKKERLQLGANPRDERASDAARLR